MWPKYKVQIVPNVPTFAILLLMGRGLFMTVINLKFTSVISRDLAEYDRN